MTALRLGDTIREPVQSGERVLLDAHAPSEDRRPCDWDDKLDNDVHNSQRVVVSAEANVVSDVLEQPERNAVCVVEIGPMRLSVLIVLSRGHKRSGATRLSQEELATGRLAGRAIRHPIEFELAGNELGSVAEV